MENKEHAKDERVERLLVQVKSLPDKPGVYQYFNKDQQIIYVGKAKNLKKRVYSYFSKEHTFGKLRRLVSQIESMRIIVVETEMDALLLENNLIKKHQPRYNIALKDDKTYPWICLKNEPFPRVFVTRRVIRDGSQYFGPYTNGKMMHTLLDLIKQLFPLRNCNLNLIDENINGGKFKVCLEYHLKNCMGPCVGHETAQAYEQKTARIKDILKGNIFQVIGYLKELKNGFAESQDFEQAQQIKEKIELLENYRSKSVVVSPTIHQVDVFSVVADEEAGYVNFLSVVNGAIVRTHTFELKKKLEESEEELLSLAITEARQRFESDAKEIIVPIIPEFEIPGIEFTIPKIGDKKHLLELSLRNAKYYRHEKIMISPGLTKEHKLTKQLEEMKKDLRLNSLPRVIECFDNSNFQGDYAVAAMSVYRNLKPSKKDYRHFNIKTVEGPDDFASMEEVISRRYKRLLDENGELPQLIIVDGGKGQLSSALGALEKLNLRGKINIISIAKKLEEIYYPDDSLPMYLDKRSQSLKIIQGLRDEAHRFGINHHRTKRDKGTLKTELTEIPGIGAKTAEKLLKHFKSVEGIKRATLVEWEKVAGKKVGSLLRSYFKV